MFKRAMVPSKHTPAGLSRQVEDSLPGEGDPIDRRLPPQRKTPQGYLRVGSQDLSIKSPVGFHFSTAPNYGISREGYFRRKSKVQDQH
jgi:hypothetical protein